MTDRLHLSPRHRAEIEALLRKHLPNVEVWAYGSRVTGRSHDGSDLDLVLRAPGLQKIPAAALADLADSIRAPTRWPTSKAPNAPAYGQPRRPATRRPQTTRGQRVRQELIAGHYPWLVRGDFRSGQHRTA